MEYPISVNPSSEQMFTYIQHLASKGNKETIMANLEVNERTATDLLSKLEGGRLNADSFKSESNFVNVMAPVAITLFATIKGRSFHHHLPPTFTMDRSDLSTEFSDFWKVLNGPETATEGSFNRAEKLVRSPVDEGPTVTKSPIPLKLFEEIQEELRLGFVEGVYEDMTTKTLRLFVEGWGDHEEGLEKRPINVNVITGIGYEPTIGVKQLYVMDSVTSPRTNLRAGDFMLSGVMLANGIYPLGHGGLPWPIRTPVAVK